MSLLNFWEEKNFKKKTESALRTTNKTKISFKKTGLPIRIRKKNKNPIHLNWIQTLNLPSNFDKDLGLDPGPYYFLEDWRKFRQKIQYRYTVQILKSSVADPWHFGVDPDPRIHSSD